VVVTIKTNVVETMTCHLEAEEGKGKKLPLGIIRIYRKGLERK